MRLIAKVISISLAKFQCNRLTTVQDIQDYASLIFWGLSIVAVFYCSVLFYCSCMYWCKAYT